MKQFRVCAAALLVALASSAPAAAFSDSWVMTINANVGGSYTIPSISSSDLDLLYCNSMSGMLGFVAGGELEVGYIWSSSTAFGLREGHPFSGIGVFFDLGISQGYSGQSAARTVSGEDVNVYVNIYYTPVISLGATGKAYFFNNRMAVGLGLGTKIICDTAPQYEIYASDSTVLAEEVGTIIVDEWMMTHMNPFMFYVKPSIEYIIPILPTVEINLGGYVAFTVYKPKYITMPASVLDLLESANMAFDTTTPLNSYFMNALDFGVVLGMNFKL